MKKITLILFAIFSFVLSPLAFANNIPGSLNTAFYNYNHSYGEKFTFAEGGITFSVFQNGEFDFYINPRSGIHTNVDLGLTSISYNSGYNYNAYVQYDDYGAIVQIENVPVYYDYYGRLIGVGNVNINYRSNRLIRIGGLYVHYNTYGYYSHYNGFINNYNRYYVYQPYHNYFIRPNYNSCVVSYNPYRRYYKPHRYNYTYGKKYYRKNYIKGRTYKKIDSRVRTALSDKTYQKRSNNNRRITANNNNNGNRVLRGSLRSNNDHSIRSRSFNKKQVSNRNIRPARDMVSNSKFKVSHDLRKERSSTSQRRNVGSRNIPAKNAKKHNSTQRSRDDNYKSRSTHVSERKTIQRSSSKSNNNRQTKVQNSIRKKNLHPHSKRTVASRS